METAAVAQNFEGLFKSMSFQVILDIIMDVLCYLQNGFPSNKRKHKFYCEISKTKKSKRACISLHNLFTTCEGCIILYYIIFFVHIYIVNTVTPTLL